MQLKTELMLSGITENSNKGGCRKGTSKVKKL